MKNVCLIAFLAFAFSLSSCQKECQCQTTTTTVTGFETAGDPPEQVPVTSESSSMSSGSCDNSLENGVWLTAVPEANWAQGDVVKVVTLCNRQY